MKVKFILDAVQEVINDVRGVTYSSTQVFNWIDDAVRVLLSKRPDALVELRSVRLVPGTKQALPGDTHKLMGIIRNMGTNGAIPGKAVRGPIAQEELDTFNPDWHNDLAVTEISEYIYNAASPLHYYVTPPVHTITAVYVEMRLATNHVAVVDENTDVPIIEQYTPALVEWCLYRLFSRDSEKSPNYARAAKHYSQFFQILGEKVAVDATVDPKVIENL